MLECPLCGQDGQACCGGRLQKQIDALDGRRRELRMLLAKLVRYTRKQCATVPGVEPVENLLAKIDDYLQRTHEPHDLLRGTPVPCTCGAASEPDYYRGDCIAPCPRAVDS